MRIYLPLRMIQPGRKGRRLPILRKRRFRIFRIIRPIRAQPGALAVQMHIAQINRHTIILGAKARFAIHPAGKGIAACLGQGRMRLPGAQRQPGKEHRRYARHQRRQTIAPQGNRRQQANRQRRQEPAVKRQPQPWQNARAKAQCQQHQDTARAAILHVIPPRSGPSAQAERQDRPAVPRAAAYPHHIPA